MPFRAFTLQEMAEAIHPEDRVDALNTFYHVKNQPDSKTHTQCRCNFNGKGYIWYELRYVNPTEAMAETASIIGLITNVQHFKDKEEELMRAKDLAIEAELKQSFLANMSHEIRTPLNAIVGFSSLLAETDEAELRHVYMSLVQENNELLLNLISDILDISKIEAGMIDLVMGRVDVPQLCREVIATFSHKKRDTAVELRFDENSPQIVIDADKNRIMQVLSNFLTNALKFTTKGSITLSYTLEDENQVRFCVTDTGKGIPDEQKHEIFNRFVKLDSFVQGAGLGLSICQSLVNRMGGKIGVESREGEGSCFWFTHPYVPGA